MSLQAEEPGANCFECYRPVWSGEFHYDEKYFCSETCMDRYLTLLKVNHKICRKTAPTVEPPSSKPKDSEKKDYGSARLAAAPTTNKSNKCFCSGTNGADLHPCFTILLQ
jgi:hypothetical protein